MEYQNCPNCPNQGWYAGINYYTGETEQIQCEFCECEPNSVFNTFRNIQAELATAKQERDEFERLFKEATSGLHKFSLELAALQNSLPKIKADAVREAAAQCCPLPSGTPDDVSDFIDGYCEALHEICKYANQLEAGE